MKQWYALNAFRYSYKVGVEWNNLSIPKRQR